MSHTAAAIASNSDMASLKDGMDYARFMVNDHRLNGNKRGMALWSKRARLYHRRITELDGRQAWFLNLLATNLGSN